MSTLCDLHKSVFVPGGILSMGQGGVEFGEGSTWSKFKNGKLQAELEEGRLSVQNREGRRRRDPVMLR